MDALTLSMILLWVAVIVLGLLVWALARQVGVLFERVAPMGALITDAGPAIGEAAPPMSLDAIESDAVLIGGVQPRAQLLFFLSPTCPVCKKLLPVLKAAVRDEAGRVRVVLASDGESAEHLAFVREQGLQGMPYVLSTELGLTYRVSRLPYGILIDAQGIVRAKGLVNSREHLDSLLNAHDLGAPSIQQYLGAADAA